MSEEPKGYEYNQAVNDILFAAMALVKAKRRWKKKTLTDAEFNLALAVDNWLKVDE